MPNIEKKCITCANVAKCDWECRQCLSRKDYSNWKPRYPDYWKNISAIKDAQTAKGVNEYGQTLEENTDLAPIERLTMLEEELIDGLMYIEHLKESLRKYKVWQ